MRSPLKFLATAVIIAFVSTVLPSSLSAQCAECRGTAPCAYGPFASKKGECTYVAGLCFEAGVCGEDETFDVSLADFSLDGLAVVEPRNSERDQSVPEAERRDVNSLRFFNSRHVQRHCSGLIVAVAG